MTYHARGTLRSFRKKFILLHELEEELYLVKRLVERKTEELQESENLLESIIDSSPTRTSTCFRLGIHLNPGGDPYDGEK